MPLHRLAKIVRHKKRRGRGIGSRGAKSGRGQKGQKSRAGYSSKAGFEGGQTPLYMRLPKGRGSKQKFPSQTVKFEEVTIRALRRFSAGSIVGPGQFQKNGLLENPLGKLKLIGAGEPPAKLTVRVHAVSAGAQAAIEKNGGKVELISV